MLSKHRIPATLAPGAQGAPADGGRSGADDSSLLWRTWIRTKWLRSERSTMWFCRPCHLRNQDSSHTDAVSIQVGCIVHFFLLSRFSRIRTPQVSYLRGRQASATPNSICIFCLWWAFSQTKFCRFCTAGPTKTVVIHLVEIIPYGFTHYHVFANVLIVTIPSVLLTGNAVPDSSQQLSYILAMNKEWRFAKANKALTTLKFKEVKMTAVKRNIKSLLNEMGMASQPFRRKRQSGGKSARQQLCNHWRLRCKGAIWCNATREPRQLSATFLCQCEDLEHVMSLTQFRKRLLQRRIFSSGLRCNVKYFEFWWFPVSDLHHEISSCLFFTFVLLQQFSQKFHWQVATMAEVAGWSESAPRGQDSAQQSKTGKTTPSDAEFQTGLLGCNKVAKNINTKNLRRTKHGKCARASTKGPNLILITTHMLSMPCSVCLCLTDLLVPWIRNSLRSDVMHNWQRLGV